MNESDLKQIEKIITEFEGSAYVLERYISTYVLGRLFGYKFLKMIHCQKTLTDFKINTGVDYRKEFPRYTVLSNRSAGIVYAQVMDRYHDKILFQKICKGEHKFKDKATVLPPGHHNREQLAQYGIYVPFI